MSVKCDWHVPNLDLPEDDDPFDLRDAATVVDLTTDRDKLHQRLDKLLRVEASLDRGGVTCEIKDRADTACSACPLYRGATRERIAPLCRVGREEESILTKLAVITAEEHREAQDQVGSEAVRA